jgi:hypothetical protein
MHRYPMTTILEQRLGDGSIKQILLLSYSAEEDRLKEAIQEIIGVLEESS